MKAIRPDSPLDEIPDVERKSDPFALSLSKGVLRHAQHERFGIIQTWRSPLRNQRSTVAKRVALRPTQKGPTSLSAPGRRASIVGGAPKASPLIGGRRHVRTRPRGRLVGHCGRLGGSSALASEHRVPASAACSAPRRNAAPRPGRVAAVRSCHPCGHWCRPAASRPRARLLPVKGSNHAPDTVLRVFLPRSLARTPAKALT